MKIMRRLISIVAMSFCSTILVSPKTITVKLFKTDQGTWGRQFSYALQTQTSGKKMKIPVLRPEPDLEIKTVLSTYKPIRKDGKISFDDADDAHILHVCTKPNGKGTCHEFNLADHNLTNVIGIDKHGVPSSMSKQEVDRLIDESAPPALYPVTVKKTGNNRASWNIKAIRSDKGSPDVNVVYSEINIKRDSSLMLKKFKVPYATELFIVVNGKTPQKFNNIAPDAVLYIDDAGIVTIGGETAESLAIKEEEHKAEVARLQAERAQKKAAAFEVDRKRKQEQRAQEETILRRQVATRKKLLQRAKQAKKVHELDELSQIDALKLLIDDQKKRGDQDNASRLEKILADVDLKAMASGFGQADAIQQLSEMDNMQALRLLRELRTAQLEEFEGKLKEAIVQTEAAIAIHFPEESGAALAEPTGAKEVHVKRRQ